MLRGLNHLVILLALSVTPAVQAQELIKEALASFPPETIRLEFSSPARLRALPNYASLRRRYTGPLLARIEASLSQIGIQESDIDELIMGWRSEQKEMGLYGLAAGRFDTQRIGQAASAHGLAPQSIAGRPAYCLESRPGATCVIVFTDNRGAFGSAQVLGGLAQARGGAGAQTLETSQRLVKALTETRTDAPIWGVATGPAVVDWFRGWIPGQENLQLDWSRAFENVEATAYSVQVAAKVELNVTMDCKTPESTVNLRQVMEGVKLFQRVVWQNQYPNRPNPFDGLELDTQGSRVLLRLTSSSADLEAGLPPLKP